MKADEIEALGLERGDKLRLNLPSGTVEGTLESVTDGILVLVGTHGKSVIKIGQIQAVTQYADA
jgi:hypothetical protein